MVEHPVEHEGRVTESDGALEEALAMVLSVKEELPPVQFVEYVVRALTKTGDIAGALAAARSLTEPSHRSEALVNIAAALLESATLKDLIIGACCPFRSGAKSYTDMD